MNHSQNQGLPLTQGLQLKKVVKKFGDTVVVNDVSFQLRRGKMLTLLGPSGCGKTTTLRMIAGLEQVTAGSIYLDGKDITLTHPAKRGIGMVFQSYALFPHMNVYDNISYGLVEAKVSSDERKSRVDEVLKTVGLMKLEKRFPANLSGGQQQRVALARSLVIKPSLLLFDEPLSNLDTVLRTDIRMEIRDLQQKFNLTSVYVTHDQEEALAISDEIIVMKDGIVQQHSAPRQFYSHPKTEFIAEFMGNASILKVQVSTSDKGGIVIQHKNFLLKLPSNESVGKGALKIAVRPYDIKIHKTNNGTFLPGKIVRSTYLGAFTHFKVLTEFGTAEIMSQEEFSFNGDEVYLELNPHKVAIVG